MKIGRAASAAASITGLLALLAIGNSCAPAGAYDDTTDTSERDGDSELDYEEWAIPIPCEHHPVDPWDHQVDGFEDAREDEPCVLPVPIELRCSDAVPIFEEGKFVGDICPKDALRSGLTVVDLSAEWAPRVLGGNEELGPVPYRDVYLALAQEQWGDDPVWDRARSDRFLELYGVFPTPELVLNRLGDDERQQCHAAVQHRWLPEVDARGIDTWRNLDEQRNDAVTIPALVARLRDIAEMEGLTGIEDLADHPKYGAYYKRFLTLSGQVGAVSELQQHLKCEGLLTRGRDGLMDQWTVEAMQLYHRRHMIVSWQLDRETARVLMTDARELDFLTLLRALRERVVDATGLIADGTAANAPEQVMGRTIDTDVFLSRISDDPLPLGERDRIAEATDAAARSLGWTGPEEALDFYDKYGLPTRVALRLPPRPWYRADHMEMHVEIDRGDVWYDYPFTPNGDRAYQPRERRPNVVIYADTDRASIPLVRWPTTVGSWMPERLPDRSVKLVYKESPAGPRVIRDVVASPRWIPPYTTPDRDLMRPRTNGVWVPRDSTFGPDYASAYGLAMMIHHRYDGVRKGEPIYTDQGIRTHGSVSYASILDGFSHGCHRVHNHRAVRMAGFLLAHRDHEVRGPIPLGVSRLIRFRGESHRLVFDSRGFRYELTPPLDVEVLRGRIFGNTSTPGVPHPLTRPMLERYGMAP